MIKGRIPIGKMRYSVPQWCRIMHCLFQEASRERHTARHWVMETKRVLCWVLSLPVQMHALTLHIRRLTIVWRLIYGRTTDGRSLCQHPYRIRWEVKPDQV